MFSVVLSIVLSVGLSVVLSVVLSVGLSVVLSVGLSVVLSVGLGVGLRVVLWCRGSWNRLGPRDMSSRWVFQCHGSGSPIASNASLLRISDGLTDRAQSLHIDLLLLPPSVFLRRATKKY